MPILLVILAIVLGGLGLTRLIDNRLRQMADNEARMIFLAASTAPDGTFRHSDLDGLPAPVQRYLKRSLPDGYPLIRHVRLKQTGTLSTNNGENWFPFRAVQYFTTQPPAFVWLARGWLMPLVWITTRDKYISGRGNMLVKPLSMITAADATGEAMDQGSLARYLAETMWFPTALLPSDHLHWEAIDDHNARVTLRDHHSEMTVTFTFNEADDVVQVEGVRYRDGSATPQPWGGKALAYRSFDGVRIPSEVEVYWNGPEGYQPYYRGTITEVDYNTPDLY